MKEQIRTGFCTPQESCRPIREGKGEAIMGRGVGGERIARNVGTVDTDMLPYQGYQV